MSKNDWHCHKSTDPTESVPVESIYLMGKSHLVVTFCSTREVLCANLSALSKRCISAWVSACRVLARRKPHVKQQSMTAARKLASATATKGFLNECNAANTLANFKKCDRTRLPHQTPGLVRATSSQEGRGMAGYVVSPGRMPANRCSSQGPCVTVSQCVTVHSSTTKKPQFYWWL